MNDSILMRGSVAKTSPNLGSLATTTLNAPFGHAVCSITSASISAAMGVRSAGFVLNDWVADRHQLGRILWTPRFNGKLNGVMAPTGPKSGESVA